MNDYQPSDVDSFQASNNVLAKYFDAFIQKSGAALRESVKDFETGSIRTLAFMNPAATFGIGHSDIKYFDYMSATNQLIRAEDYRMLHSIKSLILKPKVIYNMTFVIVSFSLSKMPDKNKRSLIERRSEIEKMIKDLINKQAVKAAAKYALIEVISRIIALEISRSPEVILMSKKLVAKILTIFQIFSYFDKASHAARKLQREHRVIYNILYAQKVEMLYFIIEEKIDPIINIEVTNDSSNADALMYALAKVFYAR